MSLFLLFTFIFPGLIWLWVNTYRYIFSGMNIHLPAILGFTRYCRLYQGFDPPPYCIRKSTRASARTPSGVSRPLHSTTDANHSTSSPPRKKSVPLVARITSHGGWDGWKFRVENLGFEGWKFRVFDGFLSIFLYFGLVEGIKSQETMLLNHHNFSLPIRKSRGFAVGKTHLVRLKPSSLAHECGYWGESKAGVVHVHILAVSFRGITQKVRLSIYIICIASLMPMHTHSDIYIYVLYIIYTHIHKHTMVILEMPSSTQQRLSWEPLRLHGVPGCGWCNLATGGKKLDASRSFGRIQFWGWDYWGLIHWSKNSPNLPHSKTQHPPIFFGPYLVSSLNWFCGGV